jgi:hypothetical protein
MSRFFPDKRKDDLNGFSVAMNIQELGEEALDWY